METCIQSRRWYGLIKVNKIMVTIVKHEWHQVDVQYAIELDEAMLAEIYPDLDETAIASLLEQIALGEVDIEDVVHDAYDSNVDIEWEHQQDDMWTMRKGGYDVTYELGTDDSWYEEPVREPTHKCTKCKWTGQEYEADWDFTEEKTVNKVCPYCESDIEPIKEM